MDQPQALDALSALANETRLQIVRLLIGRGHETGCPHGTDSDDTCQTPAPAPDQDPGLPAGAIAQEVSVTASRLSFHLNALEQAGLVAAERRGRQVFYRVDRHALGGLFHYLLHDCCRGDPQVRASCRAEAAPQLRHH
ncbi:MAG: helix-turn-helix transcriptional regulator [Rhodobacteraceae bacterium]|nr:helix-turn-helix transcriptional regulator [Paracoccaceae bacterium]MBR9822933.1 helix-turn-helix transcriptional regulator [Paracoccaceae bacterium]